MKSIFYKNDYDANASIKKSGIKDLDFYSFVRYAFFKINFLEKISADCRHMLFVCRVCIVQVFPRRNNHFIFSSKSAFFSLMDRHQLCYPGIGYGLYCYKRYRYYSKRDNCTKT